MAESATLLRPTGRRLIAIKMMTGAPRGRGVASVARVPSTMHAVTERRLARSASDALRADLRALS